MTVTMTFSERAKHLRERAGLSFFDVGYRVRDYQKTLKPHAKSYGMIERIEKGEKAEEDTDVVFLGMLAKIYGCELEELSPLAAERAGTVIDLLEYAPRDSNP